MNCDRDTPWLPKEDCSDEKVYSKEGVRGLRLGLGGGAGGQGALTPSLGPRGRQV